MSGDIGEKSTADSQCLPTSARCLRTFSRCREISADFRGYSRMSEDIGEMSTTDSRCLRTLARCLQTFPKCWATSRHISRHPRNVGRHWADFLGHWRNVGRYLRNVDFRFAMSPDIWPMSGDISPPSGDRFAERLGDRLDQHGPALLHLGRVLRPARMQLAGQGQLAAGLQRLDFDGHPVPVRRLLGDRPGEDQAARTVDLQVLARVLDLLAIPPVAEGEEAAHPQADVV